MGLRKRRTDVAETNDDIVILGTPHRRRERDSLLERNRRYHELLARLNIDHQFFTVPGVGHDGAKVYDLIGEDAFTFYH